MCLPGVLGVRVACIFYGICMTRKVLQKQKSISSFRQAQGSAATSGGNLSLTFSFLSLVHCFFTIAPGLQAFHLKYIVPSTWHVNLYIFLSSACIYNNIMFRRNPFHYFCLSCNWDMISSLGLDVWTVLRNKCPYRSFWVGLLQWSMDDVALRHFLMSRARSKCNLKHLQCQTASWSSWHCGHPNSRGIEIQVSLLKRSPKLFSTSTLGLRCKVCPI